MVEYRSSGSGNGQSPQDRPEQGGHGIQDDRKEYDRGEDHRASASRQPRSIYGKIVAEADRDLDINEVFTRAIQYGQEKYPEKNLDEQWERFKKHMEEKYGRNGYIKLWIPNSPNSQKLRNIQDIIDDKEKLKKVFTEIYQKIKR